jgi:RNA polymerase sigma factor (sigma-70 family)
MSLAVSATHASPSCSEHELVAAVRRGDDRAFEQLYSRYRQRIGAYIHGMVGDHGRAEDITQEVFISALRRMRDSERPIAFKPWIYEIAKNACIDDFRRVRRAREVPIGADGELEHGNPRLIGRTQTPDTAIENRQHLTDLRGAFRGLSDNHHQIIVLRELEGLSYAEIGERMGMTRPIVESTLFRARRRLTEEYDELISGRRCTHVQGVISERGSRAFRSLGIKERRLVARHLAHCQPCRRHAYMHGFEMQPPTVIGKIAALLPIPAIFRLRQSAGGTGAGSRLGRAVAATRSRAFDALQSAQSVTAYVDPSAPAGGISRVAAAAVATLAIAGAGGGLIAATSGSAPHRPAHVVRAGATGAGSTGAKAGRAGHTGGAASASLGAGTRAAQNAGSRGARGLTTTNSGSGSGATGQGAAAGRGGSTGTTANGGVSQTGGSATRSSGQGASGSGSVTSATSNVLNSVLNNVPKVNLPSPTLPTLPPVTLPTLRLPTLPTTGSSGGTGSGSPVRLPDPTTVIQKVLRGTGLP